MITIRDHLPTVTRNTAASNACRFVFRRDAFETSGNSDKSIDHIRRPLGDRFAHARARSAESPKPRASIEYPRASAHCVVSTTKAAAAATRSSNVHGHDGEGPRKGCPESRAQKPG